MDFFEVIKKRRSIRRFEPREFPDAAIEKAFEAASLAPNSSNTQTWDFHWVKSPETKAALVHACLSQSAARTANHLVVFTADPTRWKRSQQPLLEWVKKANAPKIVVLYYERLIPYTYRAGFLNLFAFPKWLVSFITGFFRPILRGPFTQRDLEDVAVKSAALAAENFVLAITAQGGSTCMMEGFDLWRVKRALKLKRTTRVVMVVGVGYEAERGTWGPQFRLPLNEVIHIH